MIRDTLEESGNFKTHLDVNLSIAQFVIFKANFVGEKTGKLVVGLIFHLSLITLDSKS